MITTIAGNGTSGYSGDGSAATNAALSPGMVATYNGVQYIGDPVHNVVRAVSASGGITTVAGSGSTTYTQGHMGDGGPATDAQLFGITGLAFDSSGNMYISEMNYIKVVCHVTTGVVCSGRTVGYIYNYAGAVPTAGSSSLPSCMSNNYPAVGPSGCDGAQATDALMYPSALAIDSAGNVYFSTGAYIEKVNASTSLLSTVAGNGVEGYSIDGCAGTDSELNTIGGMAFEPSQGILFFSETGTDRVRYIDGFGDVQTAAGTGSPGFDGGGNPGNTSEFMRPTGIALDSNSNLYIADTGNQRIRVLSTQSGWVYSSWSSNSLNTYAGNGTQGYAGDGGLAIAADLNSPVGITVDPASNFLYIADSGNNRLRKVAPSTSSFQQPQMAVACSPNAVLFTTVTACRVTLPAAATGSVTLSPIAFENIWPPLQLDGSGSSVFVINVSAFADNSLPSGTQYPITVTYSGDGTYSPASASTVLTLRNPDNTGGSGSGSGSVAALYSYSIATSTGASGYAPNGNILSYTDSVTGSWSGIAYDHLNRLISATQTAVGTPALTFNWGYDAFGNRLSQTLTPSAGGMTLPSVQNGGTGYTANNQVDAFYYDAGGNTRSDGANTYLYDGDGRVCAVAGPPPFSGGQGSMYQYLYDAEGNRVAKGTITSWSCDDSPGSNGLPNNGFSLKSSYVFGPNGEELTVMNVAGGSPVWDHTNVYAGGRLVATYDTKGLHYQITDWLGTKRVQTDPNGNVEETCSSLAFGDGQNCANPSTAPSTADDASNLHFTGKERDAESGLDYFPARYLGSSMGRWMSPDWSAKEEPVPYAKLDDPQTLNLYRYAGNNPLVNVDKDGHLEAPWHAVITYFAARNTGHSVLQSASLAAKTAWVDFRKGSQHTDAEHSSWHGMRGTKPNGQLESTAESHEATATTVTKAMKAGDTPLALHAVEDSPVPMHDGHAWTGVFSKSFPEHFVEDNLPTPTTVMNSYTNAKIVLSGENPLNLGGNPAPPAPPPPQPTPPPATVNQQH